MWYNGVILGVARCVLVFVVRSGIVRKGVASYGLVL